MKRICTIALNNVFVLIQYLLITFLANHDAKLDMHIQEQSKLLSSKHHKQVTEYAVCVCVCVCVVFNLSKMKR